MTIRMSANRMDMDDKNVVKAMLKDYGEAVNVLGAGGGTRDIDIRLGNVVTATVSTSANTFTFSNPSASGTACSFTLVLTNGGSQTVNWPSAVSWADGTAPTLTVEGVDILTFITTNAGSDWYGFLGGSVTPTNYLFAWGNNTSGRLGLGDTANRSSPVQVGARGVWTILAASGQHSFGILSDGTLWAWGEGANGKLGDNAASDRSSPVQIGSLTTWSNVSIGGSHTLALKTDGTLWAWGGNVDGRVGDESVTSRSSPVQIGSLTTWSKVNAGGYNSHAIKTDGTLWGWGDGGVGKVGDNTTTSRSSPVQIGSLNTWVHVSGSRSQLAIKTDGTLWAWGNNGEGRLGLGDVTSRLSPVQVGSMTDWSTVAAEWTHTLALKTDGTLWAWGRGNEGQLGQGTSAVSRSSPVQIGSLTTWVAIAAGDYHSVGLQTNGTLWVWGQDSSGQLGQGTTTNRSSPVQVGSLTTWKTSISAGATQTLAIKKG